MDNFIERLKEPSTYASISSLALLFGLVTAPQAAAISLISDWMPATVVGVTGLAGVFLPEKEKGEKDGKTKSK